MEKLINDLMSNNITLSMFLKESVKIKEINEELIFKTLDTFEDEDRSAIVFLVLYYICKHHFTKTNPFISFLNSIEDETDNDFTKEYEFHYVEGNIIIFQIDHLYFIVNNSSDPVSVTLPSVLQNDYQFCVNCNHDLYFDEQLLVEPYEFYIISDAK